MQLSCKHAQVQDSEFRGSVFTVQGYLALVDFGRAGSLANCHASTNPDEPVVAKRKSRIIVEMQIEEKKRSGAFSKRLKKGLFFMLQLYNFLVKLQCINTRQL
jgi:hypothetical protein